MHNLRDPVYRETVDRLGEDEREGEAVRMLGRWRDRTKATALAIGGVVGVVLGSIGYYVMQEIQFDHGGVASIKVSITAAMAAWLATFVASAFIGRRVVLARTTAKLGVLARDYEVPIEKLRDIANMVGKL